MPRPASRMICALAVVAAASLALSGRAQSRELTPSGVSVDVGIEQNVDSSVTQADDGPGTASRSGHLDANLLANVGDLAFGAGIAFAPNVLGNGRLLVGGRAGWQPLFGRNRVHFLGEAGVDRFEDVGGNFFGSSTPSVFETPYAGADVGVTRSFGRSPIEYGLSVHLRQDLEQQTVVHTQGGIALLGSALEPVVTQYTLGGTMVGVTLTIGLRAESHGTAPVATD